ncbi:glycine betaine ABC transporter substrate-binding protein [Rhizobium sp. NXC24]|uniref:glycine betaine ABC transporter substrate-binding protein n=1 Tax=Rhizobium sp. NXC24 TaxID=2048897 RepID=UPI000CDF43A2|nr:glycine betaine ABC transporter substrate-binding protein [Rhizobium sp. NXC24]AVA21342.1 proline/glycine betaine ABC transporter substrate-binding protein [Rhizobium sp. NXC24]
MRKLALYALATVAGGLFATSAAAGDKCGHVSIAEMNWASAGVIAWIDKIVLEDGYGCDVELMNGDTMPTFTSMNEKAQPDIAPELSVNAVREPLDAAIKEGRLIQAAETLSDGIVESWWVPAYVVKEHPDITSVEKALAHPELFPAPENPSRGGIMNCPAGWNCQITTANLFKALKADQKGFDLIDSGSAAGLDASIANAFENKKGWLGYYWSPTAVLAKYDMVRLPFEVPVDVKEYNSCTAVADCADPKVNSYPKGLTYAVVTKNFSETNPVAMGYITKRSWTNDIVNQVLLWKDTNQATNEETARYFLKTYPKVWSGWVPSDIAAKVTAAL